MPVRIGDVQLVAQTQDVLGEVPLWDARHATLTWIDLLKPALHRHVPRQHRTESWTPPEKLGSYALCDNGAVLIAGRGGIVGRGELAERGQRQLDLAPQKLCGQRFHWLMAPQESLHRPPSVPQLRPR